MAEHNLFLGGIRSVAPDYGMYPAPAINATQIVDVATHKGAQVTWLDRILDPTNDTALRAYLAANPVADDANEIWNSAIIPVGSIVLGYYYKIVTPVTGLAFTVRVKNIQTAATTVVAAAIDGGVIATGYVNTGVGLVGLMPYNHYLQFVPTTVPAGGILKMRIEIATLLVIPFHGQW